MLPYQINSYKIFINFNNLFYFILFLFIKLIYSFLLKMTSFFFTHYPYINFIFFIFSNVNLFLFFARLRETKKNLIEKLILNKIIHKNNNNNKLNGKPNLIKEDIEWIKDKKNMLKELLIRNSQEMLNLSLWVKNKRCRESLINEKILEEIETWEQWKNAKDEEFAKQEDYKSPENMYGCFAKLLWHIDQKRLKKIEDATQKDIKIIHLNKRYISPIREILEMKISTYNETLRSTITEFEEIFKSYYWITWKELKELEKRKSTLEKKKEEIIKENEKLQMEITIKNDEERTVKKRLRKFRKGERSHEIKKKKKKKKSKKERIYISMFFHNLKIL
ncbi:Plasmodium exported protein, unknown function [Plasmodium gallinaceum]|uniref:Uncharacterized protein n=1 Tax=Plasmodium gallinaceum TaxID=5849 RepID=A0A1J1GT94_PLAGA|nr:Plasmodium exported protein, unknown function [Plasmodium gallinaceum]CRG94517.1 Plasmodium exported protein, unknown function [Plasmodium gallinaceum]